MRRDHPAALASRLAASLCAGIGGHAGIAEIGGVHFAYRPLRSTSASSRAWRPSLLPSGRIVVFHGYFDNAADIAAKLAADASDLARLYGLAVERWKEEADRLIIGEYCAAIADVECLQLRLSRSPLRAPPLYYFHDPHLTAAASVPRALFATGIDRRLDEARMADIAIGNFHDPEASPFEKVSQVPLGSTVELVRGRVRTLRKWYDPLEIPFANEVNDQDVIKRAGELLDEGVRACLTGFRSPGSALSSGLDSPQVAVRALSALGSGQTLPTFTFHPEPSFDGRVPRGMIGDERPMVEALAAMHEGLEPHFTTNQGYGHDHRCTELFHLIGNPAGLNSMYVFHGLLSAAKARGCDVLLLAEWGNLTFSDKGECGFVEYFWTGRWRQLWLALTRPPIHTGSLLRRLVVRSLTPLLPNRLWRMLRQAFLRREHLSEHAQPLSAAYRASSGADERLERAGLIVGRYQPWNRRHSRALLFGNGDLAEVYQGFEQIYGVALRDPTAYRPFVEFCLGLPTRMFMRDGEMRWLAKQLAKGIMPDEQRENMLNGWWDADGQARIRRRRSEWLNELDQIERDERFRGMFDCPRLRAALEGLPEFTETDPQKFISAQLALPRALLTARFVNWVEGRNQP